MSDLSSSAASLEGAHLRGVTLEDSMRRSGAEGGISDLWKAAWGGGLSCW